ncbi:hypothetical protein MB901379_03680 [Mycobacterium basiliense]|uniref:Uncharacterized protein n=1 Tax=Mycobacterium basiliense TaxID=2094119 RepID=A0A447GHW3_9MYCO|nr:hypothetical protein [Mycobacterium basiliense]VDM90087.1 hypothetical protein MB901379_03680 [Mycobacterium basiliense]
MASFVTAGVGVRAPAAADLGGIEAIGSATAATAPATQVIAAGGSAGTGSPGITPGAGGSPAGNPRGIPAEGADGVGGHTS